MSRLHVPVSASDHASGPADAAVTLVEYGDYQCPYCGQAYPIVKALQQALGDSLRLVFRNFPLSEMHPDALNAARLAEAAADAGHFWSAHDLLYERQGALAPHDLQRYGELLQLPPERVRAALAGADDARIEADFMGGVRSGVNGTPCFFINGVRHDDSWDYDTLLQALQRAM
ncbi:thioredoxin domain-containing protein [Stenotrophomonas sp. YAU14D1_LEIMI4_1]|uniref:DsbA family protein n=1 Tax=Stenotrophomonas sp. YAU14D1_LEIMI4_1 TaxID=2072407 RepID=UPI000D540F54|nr:thioredoxin domain-containing protein [Stenotrophomonas sp. YAU14D1_LEIMI4_1]AWH25989.1 disulfide bond formation protein DsbA [Stenotrophomonas sp. YAU14D1_LEIMI4_1]